MKRIKIYLIATEPSGDVIGGNLINSLNKLNNKKNKLDFFGIGGPKMIDAGLKKTLFPIEKLSVVGFFEIIPKFKSIISLLKKTEVNLKKIKPDFLITIDSPDFNFRILKRLSNCLKTTNKIHYVAPTVWAWRSGRAKKLAKYIHKLFTILPFENKYFNKFKLDTKFVGHPVFDLPKNININNRTKLKYNIDGNVKIVSFLPGSRYSELKKNLPVLIKIMEKIKKKKLNIHILLHVLPHLRKYLSKYILNFKYTLVLEKDKYKSFMISDSAICASGTAALELSHFKVPTIIIYKINLISYLIAKIFVKIKYANLINIVENKEIIPEFLQFRCRPSLIIDELLKLLNNKKYSKRQTERAKKTLLKFKSYKEPSYVAAKDILDSIKIFSLKDSR